MPTANQAGQEMLEAVKEGKVPLLAEIVALEEPWRFRVLKALPNSARNWKVKPNPALVKIKADLQARAKKAKIDVEKVLPGVIVEDGEVTTVSYKFGGAVQTVNAGEKIIMPTDLAVFAMCKKDLATGIPTPLLVDEGYEGPAVKPADGTPGEIVAPEKTLSDDDLLTLSMKAKLIQDFTDQTNDPGFYYGSYDDGIFLGKTEEAVLKALKGKRKDVAEALRHQVA